MKFEIVMDAHEEYDPKHPYQGRPDQKISGKIAFTGHFDPVLQQYTLENVDANTFQTREGAEPSIIIVGQPQQVEPGYPPAETFSKAESITPDNVQQKPTDHGSAQARLLTALPKTRQEKNCQRLPIRAELLILVAINLTI